MNIDESTVRELVLRARAYDAKEEVTDSSADRESSEDVDLARATPSDPVRRDIEDFIDALDEDAQAELVALYWIGRGDFESAEYANVVAQAKARRTGPTSGYLLGVPLLGEHLEAGLDAVIEAGVADDA